MNEIINCAITEITEKTFPVTRSFLAVHELVYEKKNPKADRIDTERPDEATVVYLAVKDQNYHLALYISAIPRPVVTNVQIVPYSSISISFSAYSVTLSREQLTAMTTLEPTAGHNKGDKSWIGNSVYEDSSIIIEPNPEPDEFENKLNKLLAILEQDKTGIQQLAQAGGRIQAIITFPNNGIEPLAPVMSEESIRRMAALGLSIDFDLYATGNAWK